MNGNNLSDHFTVGPPDFLATCRHCESVCPNLSNATLLASYLEKLRTALGVPITILSGWRCPESQLAEYKKAKAAGRPATKNGYHPKMLAADVVFKSVLSKNALIELFTHLGFTGIELKDAPAGSWCVHLDLRAGGVWIADARKKQ